ncbi:vWA domain-containing protein [Streptomyces chartreusis]|uniref:vWA domain-containing protein n=1 Tax=Streptomyces chartreusis TaxID=1969 RepID=UPI0035D9E5D7
MARETEGTISRSRLHDAFTAPKLPRWVVVDALVEILASRARGADPQIELDRFHQLWQQAATRHVETPPPPGSVGLGADDASEALQPPVPQGFRFGETFSPALPVYLVLDTSASMDPAIPALNGMLHQLIDYLLTDPLLADLVYLSVISFNSDTHTVMPLRRTAEIEAVPTFGARGGTNMAKMFRALKAQLISDFSVLGSVRRWMRPLIFLITDGIPMDEGWEEAFSDLVAPSNRYRPHVVAFGVGAASQQVIGRVSTLVAYLATEGVETQGALSSAFSSLTSTIQSAATEQQVALPTEIPGFRTVPLDGL